jgi:AraC-like DNA-binding protein
MSKKRQPRRISRNKNGDEDIPIRTFAFRHLQPHSVPPHAHDWHQLIYATEGVMSVHTAQGSWVIPSHRAVWVPAGIEHSIDMSGSVLVQTIYVRTGLSSKLARNCCAVNVAPLLRELIVQAVKLGTLRASVPMHARLIGVLLDQLEVLPTIPLQLPMPKDERAVDVAKWLREHPDDAGVLKQVARRANASVRTIERLFRTETGTTFGRWRQQLRLLEALRLLAGGKAVTAVALEVGYDSPSAFIAMFRRVLGTTPSRYFAAH